VQAVKAGKFEDRYENALVELLNQEAQARAGTNGRETARYRQRRQPDGCAGKSLNDVGKGGASQPAKGRKAKKAASGQRGMLIAISGKGAAKAKGAAVGKMSPSFMSMAGARCWRRYSPNSRRWLICARRSRASSPGAPSRMASLT
jgi:hypothetical protein